jgi:hypothetical protein
MHPCPSIGDLSASLCLHAPDRHTQIQFYCLGLQTHGWSRMLMAVRSGHAHAAFAAAVVYYNGSCIDHNQRQPLAAANLFALAACRGHMGALRDLAFCVSNGLGVRQDAEAGRRLTFTANLREFRATYPTAAEQAVAYAHVVGNPGCLTSELGCFTTVPASLRGWAHPANRFLCDWFSANPLPFPPRRLLLMCSMPTCGRPETRGLEYRRCPVCGIARYCSRSCQSLHWRMGHTRECVPTHQWLMEAIANHAVVNADDGANAAAMPAVNNNSATHHNNLGGAAAAPPAPK